MKTEPHMGLMQFEKNGVYLGSVGRKFTQKEKFFLVRDCIKAYFDELKSAEKKEIFKMIQSKVN